MIIVYLNVKAEALVVLNGKKMILMLLNFSHILSMAAALSIKRIMLWPLLDSQ